MTANASPLYCVNHPAVETTLRCNRCEKPICPKCAVRTPTGYRCKECVRGQQKIFETARWYDYVLGFVTAGFLSLLASLFVSLISGVAGFFAWLIIIVAAPSAGAIIAEATRFVTSKRRARALFITVAAAVVLGALPVILLNLITLSIFGIIFQGIFLVTATPIVYTRLSGIQIFK
ncbi:MAG: hypothetical protein KKC71_03715 [Chloroflexi bacterium]|nr:hypothetical protein [Chloroflexota bacterium]